MIKGRAVWNADFLAWQGCYTQTHTATIIFIRSLLDWAHQDLVMEGGLHRGVTTSWRFIPWQVHIRKGLTFSSVVSPLTKWSAPVNNASKTHWVPEEVMKVEAKLVGKMKGLGGVVVWQETIVGSECNLFTCIKMKIHHYA